MGDAEMFGGVPAQVATDKRQLLMMPNAQVQPTPGKEKERQASGLPTGMACNTCTTGMVCSVQNKHAHFRVTTACGGVYIVVAAVGRPRTRPHSLVQQRSGSCPQPNPTTPVGDFPDSSFPDSLQLLIRSLFGGLLAAKGI